MPDLPILKPRPVSGHANYPGDITQAIEARIATMRPMGPSYLGEYLWPVEAVWNSLTDRTRVAFTLVPPAGLELP